MRARVHTLLCRGSLAALLGAAVSCNGSDATTAPERRVTTIAITMRASVLRPGDTLTVVAAARDQTGQPFVTTYSFASDNPAVVRVSDDGLARALAGGTATISASAGGKTATSSITVIPFAASVDVDSTSVTLLLGRTVQLAAMARDSNRAPIPALKVTWESRSAQIATVSPTGLVSAVGVGSTELVASADGQTVTIPVMVADPGPGRVDVIPATGWLARGLAYPLAWSSYDGLGRSVTDATVTFTSSDPTVATVSGAGVVQPLAEGTVTITATAATGRRGTSVLTVVAPRTFNGTVATADGAAPASLSVSAWIARGTASAQQFTTVVDGTTGAFALQLPTLPPSAGTVEVIVDAAAGATRRYHPSYARARADALPTAPAILLVPSTVIPDSGSYAGAAVAVSLDAAFTPVCTTTGDSNCQSYWPSYWVAGIKMWPDAARPIPLAIDRSLVAGVTAADSAALWSAIRQMERDLGRRLYEPAMFVAYTAPGYQSGAVLVSLDPSLGAGYAYSNWLWNGNGDLVAARSRFGSAGLLVNSGLVAHELNHAQGFSHTCAWATIMGGYGCPNASRMTASDVAYWHLAQLLRRRTAELRPTWGVAEALAGERVIELGRPAAQSLSATLSRMLLSSRGVDRAGPDGAH